MRYHTSHSKLLLCTALMLLAFATPTLAQEALLTKRATALRDSPADNATTLATLPAQTSINRLPARQGPWVQVKTESGATGWLHMFDIGSNAQSSNTATGALRGLSKFFQGGSAPANRTATSTVGIRGLEAEDIANAQPNMAALAQAEGLRQDATQARRFAAEATLVARNVEPLPTPTPPAAPSTNPVGVP